jgi:hypothetical protein
MVVRKKRDVFLDSEAEAVTLLTWDRLEGESKSGEFQAGLHRNRVAAGAKIAEFSSGRRLISSDIGKWKRHG